MAVPLTPEELSTLEQSRSTHYLVQSFYGSEQTVPSDEHPGTPMDPDDPESAWGVPITTDGSISFAADGQIQANGSVFVARDGGDSLVPKSKTDPLAPNGQELAITFVSQFGDARTLIPLGRFRITKVPNPVEYFRRFPATERIVSWSAQVNIADRFEQILADDYLRQPSPVAGNSSWDEIQRLSPIPIEVSLPDAPVPSGVVYEGRFQAINLLMSNLGGEPHLTRQGALTARIKDRWLTADPSDPDFTIDGTTDLATGMSLNVINSVSLTNPNDAKLLGIAEITDESNPLAITRPIGRRTKTDQNPLMNTQAKITAAAQTMLARLSGRESETATFSCLPRPDIELGDCGWIIDRINRRKVFGEVSNMVFQMDAQALMSGTVTVAEVAPLGDNE